MGSAGAAEAGDVRGRDGDEALRHDRCRGERGRRTRRAGCGHGDANRDKAGECGHSSHPEPEWLHRCIGVPSSCPEGKKGRVARIGIDAQISPCSTYLV
jgi:hypothetical protein